MKSQSVFSKNILSLTVATLLGVGTAYPVYATTMPTSKTPATQKSSSDTMHRDKTGTGNHSVTVISDSYPGWNDPVMANIAVYSAHAMIHRLQTAKDDLAAHKDQAAKTALQQARNFSEGVHTMMPFIATLDQVKNARGKILTSKKAVFIENMLPIYASVDQMEFYAPDLAHRVRKELKGVEKHVRNDERQQAGKQLDNIVDDISGTAVYLPVLYVQDQTDVALRDLQQKKPDTRDATRKIDNALDSLVTIGAGAITLESRPTGS